MEGDIFDTLKNEFNIEEEKAEAVSESPKYIQKVEEKQTASYQNKQMECQEGGFGSSAKQRSE